jgi:hypothetical protein
LDLATGRYAKVFILRLIFIDGLVVGKVQF